MTPHQLQTLLTQFDHWLPATPEVTLERETILSLFRETIALRAQLEALAQVALDKPVDPGWEALYTVGEHPTVRRVRELLATRRRTWQEPYA